MATTATVDSGSGDDGAAAPVVRGDGGGVGRVRRSEGKSMVESGELEGGSGRPEQGNGAAAASGSGERLRRGERVFGRGEVQNWARGV